MFGWGKYSPSPASQLARHVYTLNSIFSIANEFKFIREIKTLHWIARHYDGITNFFEFRFWGNLEVLFMYGREITFKWDCDWWSRELSFNFIQFFSFSNTNKVLLRLVLCIQRKYAPTQIVFLKLSFFTQFVILSAIRQGNISIVQDAGKYKNQEILNSKRKI